MKDRMINIAAFTILAGLWLIFGALLVFNPTQLDAAWQTLRGWPLVVQGLVWLLTLPVTLGLWIWQTSWPVLLRVILVAGLALATLYTFLPRRTSARTEVSPV